MNSTVALTLILLSLMVSAGVASALWGYHLGRDSLKGVTQPDARPINNVAEGDARREGLTLLREEDILANVKARIEGGANPSTEATQDSAVPNP
ncbi:MAG: hypothetical protein HC769_05305 [Cyanobacteria bacterium CRU_2_1]|nr:hypothetical protein [Cyanobacteria bacterium CRU_2_1]